MVGLFAALVAPAVVLAQPGVSGLASGDAIVGAASVGLVADAHTDLDLSCLKVDPLGEGMIGKSSGFGWRDDPIRHTSKFHGGSDLRAHPGTPIFAAGDGTVVFAGQQGGYGNVVYIDHGGGIVTRYGHMRRILTKKSLALHAGDIIGQVGSTGRATGPHLHFEVRLDGRAVNPVDAMAVATLMRTDPEAGKLAMAKLAPALQTHTLSDVDPPKSHHAKRSQALW